MVRGKTAPGPARLGDVTFTLSGNKDDTKAAFDLFDKLRKGDSWRGSLTVQLLEPGTFAELVGFELTGLTLLDYGPGPDTGNPSTLGFMMTVRPSGMVIH
jgi:hypothetical protein